MIQTGAVFLRHFMRVTVRCQCGAASYESYASRDKDNSHPPQWTDLLMKHKARHEGQKHVSKGGRWKHVREVGPGKGGHVAGEKSEQEKDAAANPGIGKRDEHRVQVLKGNAAGLLHAM